MSAEHTDEAFPDDGGGGVVGEVLGEEGSGGGRVWRGGPAARGRIAEGGGEGGEVAPRSSDSAEYCALLSAARESGGARRLVESTCFVYPGGWTKTGVPLVVFAPHMIPLSSGESEDALLRVALLGLCLALDKIAEQRFGLVYVHLGANWVGRGRFRWLQSVYGRLPRRFKKNLAKLYLLHPTWPLRSFLGLSSTFVSRKFWAKVTFCKSVNHLLLHTQHHSLLLPAFLLEHDHGKPARRAITHSIAQKRLVKEKQRDAPGGREGDDDKDGDKSPSPPISLPLPLLPLSEGVEHVLMSSFRVMRVTLEDDEVEEARGKVREIEVVEEEEGVGSGGEGGVDLPPSSSTSSIPRPPPPMLGRETHPPGTSSSTSSGKGSIGSRELRKKSASLRMLNLDELGFTSLFGGRGRGRGRGRGGGRMDGEKDIGSEEERRRKSVVEERRRGVEGSGGGESGRGGGGGSGGVREKDVGLFGRDLEEVVRMEGVRRGGIPRVVDWVVASLLGSGVDKFEGLFRVPPSKPLQTALVRLIEKTWKMEQGIPDSPRRATEPPLPHSPLTATPSPPTRSSLPSLFSSIFRRHPSSPTTPPTSPSTPKSPSTPEEEKRMDKEALVLYKKLRAWGEWEEKERRSGGAGVLGGVGRGSGSEGGRGSVEKRMGSVSSKSSSLRKLDVAQLSSHHDSDPIQPKKLVSLSPRSPRSSRASDEGERRESVGVGGEESVVGKARGGVKSMHSIEELHLWKHAKEGEGGSGGGRGRDDDGLYAHIHRASPTSSTSSSSSSFPSTTQQPTTSHPPRMQPLPVIHPAQKEEEKDAEEERSDDVSRSGIGVGVGDGEERRKSLERRSVGAHHHHSTPTPHTPPPSPPPSPSLPHSRSPSNSPSSASRHLPIPLPTSHHSHAHSKTHGPLLRSLPPPSSSSPRRRSRSIDSTSSIPPRPAPLTQREGYVAASLLSHLLSSLPHGGVFGEWDEGDSGTMLLQHLHRSHPVRYNTLHRIFHLLHSLTTTPETNITAPMLAIVLSPALFPFPPQVTPDQALQHASATATLSQQVIKQGIQQVDDERGTDKGEDQAESVKGEG